MSIHALKFRYLIIGKQLSQKCLKSTRAIASVTIHVERTIERLKEFHILQGNLPTPLVPLADKILTVCATLCTNLLPSLAKEEFYFMKVCL